MAQAKPRLFFVNRFYAPDHSATAQILTDLTRGLKGFEIHVLTGAGLYDDPSAQLPTVEILEGVTIHRVPVAGGRRDLLKRGLGYLKLYRELASSLRKLTRARDIVVAKSDPPLLSIVVERALRGRGVRLVNWLQDIYPEIAVELGVPFLKGPASRILSHLRDKSLLRAETNVVLGDVMASVLVRRNIPRSKVKIIANWVDDVVIEPVPNASNPLRSAWGLEGKLVVGYSGNLGRAHEYDTLLGAAELLRENRDIVFLFIGGGHHIDALRKRVDSLGLTNGFRFQPYQDASQLKYSLGLPDVHWLSLRENMEGLIVPSKFYGIAAAGRGTIAVCAQEGEISQLVRHFDCGVQVTPGDSAGLAHHINSFFHDRQILDRMGHNARKMIDQEFNREKSIAAWQRLLQSL